MSCHHFVSLAHTPREEDGGHCVKRPCAPQGRPYGREMSEIHAMPGHLIRRLHQISASVFADRMRTAGVDLTSPQYAALSLLADHPRIDQATLAGSIAHDRATMGGVIDRLGAKGLVERHPNPRDRRSKLLTLTPAGAALLARLRPVVAEMQDAILPGLTEAERKEFIRLAARVAEAGNALSRAPLVPASPRGEPQAASTDMPGNAAP